MRGSLWRGWLLALGGLAGTLVLASWVAPFEAQASVETNREIARIYSDYYFDQKDYTGAIAQLTAHLDADPDDGGAWHLLGLAYLLSEQYQAAASAFDRAAPKVAPGFKGIVLYYHADALNRSGDMIGAERMLKAAREEPVSAWSADKALGSNGRLEPKAALPEIVPSYPSHWSSRASLAFGYDDNVLLASNTQLATIARSDVASPTLNIADVTRFSKQGFRGSDIELQGRASYDLHTASAASVFNSLNGGVSLDWAKSGGGLRFLGLIHSLGDDFNVSFLNTHGLAFYSWDDTIRWRAHWQHGFGVETDFVIPVRYQKFSLSELSADDDRSGLAVGIQALHRRQIRLHSLSAGLIFEKLFANGINFRSYTLSLPLGWQTPLPWWGLGISLAAIPGMVLYPDSTNDRRDYNLTAMFSVARRFGSKLGASLDLLALTNPSTVDVARYNKQSIFAKVTYDLF